MLSQVRNHVHLAKHFDVLSPPLQTRRERNLPCRRLPACADWTTCTHSLPIPFRPFLVARPNTDLSFAPRRRLR